MGRKQALGKRIGTRQNGAVGGREGAGQRNRSDSSNRHLRCTKRKEGRIEEEKKRKKEKCSVVTAKARMPCPPFYKKKKSDGRRSRESMPVGRGGRVLLHLQSNNPTQPPPLNPATEQL